MPSSKKRKKCNLCPNCTASVITDEMKKLCFTLDIETTNRAPQHGAILYHARTAMYSSRIALLAKNAYRLA